MFKLMQDSGMETLHLVQDPASQLKAIIAIHSTRLGPALGGCRFIPYQQEVHAYQDALRLARGMSYKAALAGLPYGGGKAVIIEPTNSYNRAQQLQHFARFLNQLNGLYITAMDCGTSERDMDTMAKISPWVSCTSSIGDPSPYTADGVIAGISAACRTRLGNSNLRGLSFAIQGLGKVGMALAQRLYDRGAKLWVCDPKQALVETALRRFNATAVKPEAIYSVPAEVFCPCGLGGVINPDSLDQLSVKVVAGSANNQLASPRDGELLHRRNILFAPDYVINAGGLIFVALNYQKASKQAICQQIQAIDTRLTELFKQRQIAPQLLADRKAQAILDQAHIEHQAVAGGI